MGKIHATCHPCHVDTKKDLKNASQVQLGHHSVQSKISQLIDTKPDELPENRETNESAVLRFSEILNFSLFFLYLLLSGGTKRAGNSVHCRDRVNCN